MMQKSYEELEHEVHQLTLENRRLHDRLFDLQERVEAYEGECDDKGEAIYEERLRYQVLADGVRNIISAMRNDRGVGVELGLREHALRFYASKLENRLREVSIPRSY